MLRSISSFETRARGGLLNGFSIVLSIVLSMRSFSSFICFPSQMGEYPLLALHFQLPKAAIHCRKRLISPRTSFARKVPSANKIFSRKDAKAQRNPLETR
jgi:hypothetical protein